MEIFKTITAGVAVFILGQIILKLLIDPIQEMKRIISKVRMETIRTAYILHSTDNFENESINQVFDSYRELSAYLLAGMELIPFYSLSRYVFGLPSRSKLKKASTNLIALSNWVMVRRDKKLGHILKNSNELIENLGFKASESELFDKKMVDELIKSEQK